MGRMNLCTQHHAVLSLERSLSSAVGYLHVKDIEFVRILLYVECCMRNVKLSTDHGFSVFQRATHTKVVLDTAWPWASEAYGLCRLFAYFCAHKIIRPYRSADRCFKHAT